MWRYAVPVAALCVAGIGIAIGTTYSKAEAPAAPAFVSHVDGRIRYPAGRYPTLETPDGVKHPVHSLLEVQRPLRFGDYVWNEKDVPPGPVWVRVDLARQTLSVFRDGHEIGTAIILFGTDGKPTPAGTFPVMAKAATHQSSLYDASMPFMLRLTGDGVAIHASNVRRGSATHGCIGIPYRFAELLFGQIKRGDQVVILPLEPDRQAPGRPPNPTA